MDRLLSSHTDISQTHTHRADKATAERGSMPPVVLATTVTLATREFCPTLLRRSGRCPVTNMLCDSNPFCSLTPQTEPCSHLHTFSCFTDMPDDMEVWERKRECNCSYYSYYFSYFDKCYWIIILTGSILYGFGNNDLIYANQALLNWEREPSPPCLSPLPSTNYGNCLPWQQVSY